MAWKALAYTQSLITGSQQDARGQQSAAAWCRARAVPSYNQGMQTPKTPALLTPGCPQLGMGCHARLT